MTAILFRPGCVSKYTSTWIFHRPRVFALFFFVLPARAKRSKETDRPESFLAVIRSSQERQGWRLSDVEGGLGGFFIHWGLADIKPHFSLREEEWERLLRFADKFGILKGWENVFRNRRFRLHWSKFISKHKALTLIACTKNKNHLLPTNLSSRFSLSRHLKLLISRVFLI